MRAGAKGTVFEPGVVASYPRLHTARQVADTVIALFVCCAKWGNLWGAHHWGCPRVANWFQVSFQVVSIVSKWAFNWLSIVFKWGSNLIQLISIGISIVFKWAFNLFHFVSNVFKLSFKRVRCFPSFL